jgi:hypothetical protein
MSPAGRARLAGGCAIVMGIGLTLCLASVIFAGAWLKSPALHGSADYIYSCAGFNVRGRFRVGMSWNSNLAGLTPLYAAMPQIACGYYPRPFFVPPYGLWIFQL